MRKVKIRLLVWKAIVYRVLIVFLQISVTYLFTKDMRVSVNLSIIWNILNALTYFFYDLAFTSKFKIGKEE